MPRRLFVSSAVLLVWALFGWFFLNANVSSKASLDQVSATLSDPDPAWAREDLYYGVANTLRTDSIFLPRQMTMNPPTNPDRVRILVLGDSFTYGQGLTDWSARWPDRLQQFLDEKYGTSVVEVTTLARMGANMTTYGSWVRDLQAGNLSAFTGSGANSEVYATALKDPFDLVILGFVDNDYLATSWDGYVPKNEYVDIPVDDWEQVISGEKPNPNEKYFFAALKEVRQYAAPSPFVLLPLAIMPIERISSYKRFPSVRATGVDVEEPLEQERLGSNRDPKEFMATPVDAHPNSAWQAAISKDALRIVERVVSSASIASAQANADQPNHPSFHVNGFLPTSASLTRTSPTSYDFSHDGVSTIECRALAVGYGRYSKCDPPSFVVNDKTIPFQGVGCALVGAPYVQLELNPGLKDGSTVKLTLSSRSTPLSLYSYGYDENWFLKVYEVTNLQPGKSFKLRTSPEVHGLLFTSPPTGCPIQDPVIPPKFSVSISF